MYATGLDDSFGATEQSIAAMQHSITSPYRQNPQPSFEDLEAEYNRLRTSNFNLRLQMLHYEEMVEALGVGGEMSDIINNNIQLKTEMSIAKEKEKKVEELVRGLKSEIVRAGARSSELEAELVGQTATHAGEAARAKERLLQLEEHVAERCEEVDALRQANAALEGEVRALRTERARRDAEEAPERQRQAETTARVHTLQQELDAMTAKFRATCKELEAATSTADALKDAGEDAAREQEAVTKRHNAQLRRLEDTIVELEAEVRDRDNQLAEARDLESMFASETEVRTNAATHTLLKESQYKHEKEMNGMRDKMKEYDEAMSLLENKAARKDVLLTEYHGSLQVMESELSELRTKYEDYTAIFEERAARVAELEGEVVGLSHALDERDADVAVLQDAVHDVDEKDALIEQLREHIVYLEDYCAQTAQQLEEQTAVADDANTQAAALKEAVAKLQTRATSLEAQLATAAPVRATIPLALAPKQTQAGVTSPVSACSSTSFRLVEGGSEPPGPQEQGTPLSKPVRSEDDVGYSIAVTDPGGVFTPRQSVSQVRFSPKSPDRVSSGGGFDAATGDGENDDDDDDDDWGDTGDDDDGGGGGRRKTIPLIPLGQLPSGGGSVDDDTGAPARATSSGDLCDYHFPESTCNTPVVGATGDPIAGTDVDAADHASSKAKKRPAPLSLDIFSQTSTADGTGSPAPAADASAGRTATPLQRPAPVSPLRTPGGALPIATVPVSPNPRPAPVSPLRAPPRAAPALVGVEGRPMTPMMRAATPKPVPAARAALQATSQTTAMQRAMTPRASSAVLSPAGSLRRTVSQQKIQTPQASASLSVRSSSMRARTPTARATASPHARPTPMTPGARAGSSRPANFGFGTSIKRSMSSQNVPQRAQQVRPATVTTATSPGTGVSPLHRPASAFPAPTTPRGRYATAGTSPGLPPAPSARDFGTSPLRRAGSASPPTTRVAAATSPGLPSPQKPHTSHTATNPLMRVQSPSPRPSPRAVGTSPGLPPSPSSVPTMSPLQRVASKISSVAGSDTGGAAATRQVSAGVGTSPHLGPKSPGAASTRSAGIGTSPSLGAAQQRVATTSPMSVGGGGNLGRTASVLSTRSAAVGTSPAGRPATPADAFARTMSGRSTSQAAGSTLRQRAAGATRSMTPQPPGLHQRALSARSGRAVSRSGSNISRSGLDAGGGSPARQQMFDVLAGRGASFRSQMSAPRSPGAASTRSLNAAALAHAASSRSMRSTTASPEGRAASARNDMAAVLGKGLRTTSRANSPVAGASAGPAVPESPLRLTQEALAASNRTMTITKVDSPVGVMSSSYGGGLPRVLSGRSAASGRSRSAEPVAVGTRGPSTVKYQGSPRSHGSRPDAGVARGASSRSMQRGVSGRLSQAAGSPLARGASQLSQQRAPRQRAESSHSMRRGDSARSMRSTASRREDAAGKMAAVLGMGQRTASTRSVQRTAPDPQQALLPASPLNRGASSRSMQRGLSSHSMQRGASSRSMQRGLSSHSMQRGASTHSLRRGDSMRSNVSRASRHEQAATQMATVLGIKRTGSTRSNAGLRAESPLARGASSRSIQRVASSRSMQRGLSSHSMQRGASSRSMQRGLSSHSMQQGASARSMQRGDSMRSVRSTSSRHAEAANQMASLLGAGQAVTSLARGSSSRSMQRAASTRSVKQTTSVERALGLESPTLGMRAGSTRSILRGGSMRRSASMRSNASARSAQGAAAKSQMSALLNMSPKPQGAGSRSQLGGRTQSQMSTAQRGVEARDLPRIRSIDSAKSEYVGDGGSQYGSYRSLRGGTASVHAGSMRRGNSVRGGGSMRASSVRGGGSMRASSVRGLRATPSAVGRTLTPLKSQGNDFGAGRTLSDYHGSPQSATYRRTLSQNDPNSPDSTGLYLGGSPLSSRSFGHASRVGSPCVRAVTEEEYGQLMEDYTNMTTRANEMEEEMAELRERAEEAEQRVREWEVYKEKADGAMGELTSQILDGFTTQLRGEMERVDGANKKLAGLATHLRNMQQRDTERLKEIEVLRQCVENQEAEMAAQIDVKLQLEDEKLRLEFDVQRLKTNGELLSHTVEQQKQELASRRAELEKAWDKAAALEAEVQRKDDALARVSRDSMQTSSLCDAQRASLAALMKKAATADSIVHGGLDGRITHLSETVVTHVRSLKDFLEECGWGKQTLGLSQSFVESITNCTARCQQVLKEIHTLGRNAVDGGDARTGSTSPLRASPVPMMPPRNVSPHPMHDRHGKRFVSPPRQGVRAMPAEATFTADHSCLNTAVAQHETKTVEMMVDRLEGIRDTLTYHGQQRQSSLRNVLQRVGQFEEQILQQLRVLCEVLAAFKIEVGGKGGAGMGATTLMGGAATTHHHTTGNLTATTAPTVGGGNSAMLNASTATADATATTAADPTAPGGTAGGRSSPYPPQDAVVLKPRAASPVSGAPPPPQQGMPAPPPPRQHSGATPTSMTSTALWPTHPRPAAAEWSSGALGALSPITPTRPEDASTGAIGVSPGDIPVLRRYTEYPFHM